MHRSEQDGCFMFVLVKIRNHSEAYFVFIPGCLNSAVLLRALQETCNICISDLHWLGQSPVCLIHQDKGDVEKTQKEPDCFYIKINVYCYFLEVVRLCADRLHSAERTIQPPTLHFPSFVLCTWVNLKTECGPWGKTLVPDNSRRQAWSCFQSVDRPMNSVNNCWWSHLDTQRKHLCSQQLFVYHNEIIWPYSRLTEFWSISPERPSGNVKPLCL